MYKRNYSKMTIFSNNAHRHNIMGNGDLYPVPKQGFFIPGSSHQKQPPPRYITSSPYSRHPQMLNIADT